AGAIAGAGIGADRTAVFQVAQRFQRERDDVVPGSAAQRRDHRQAAGVLLERRIVQSLLRGVSAGGAIGRLEVHQSPSSVSSETGDSAGPLVQCGMTACCEASE